VKPQAPKMKLVNSPGHVLTIARAMDCSILTGSN
jgi:hypothetical protein